MHTRPLKAFKHKKKYKDSKSNIKYMNANRSWPSEFLLNTILKYIC